MDKFTSNQNAYMYSIHTLELGIRLRKHIYDKLIERLVDCSQEHNFCYYSPEDHPSILVFDLFKGFGFTYCYAQHFRADDGSFCNYCFYMIINPRRLFHIPDYRYIYVLRRLIELKISFPILLLYFKISELTL